MSNVKFRKKKRGRHFSCHKELKDIGFILLVFGLISLCAFFLSIKAWVLLLGSVLLVCGIRLYWK